jgi:phospholipase A1
LIKIYILISLIFVASLFGDVTYGEAYALYKKGDFNTSLEMFTLLADDDKDNDAAYILGYMYEHGEGCKPNIKESQKYYKISSHGYYFDHKQNPSRDSKKIQKRIYETLEKSDNEETQKTIQQSTQSLYNIKAHRANFFLPISYRYEGEYSVPAGSKHQSSQIETEFQVSLKYDFASNVLGLNEIYTASYTQLSFWQFYVNSAYFRESNYNPELFVTIPVPVVPYLKGVRMIFAHQSNGQGGRQERSWNYLSAELYFQTGFFFTELEVWKDLVNLKYNPDLMDYMGYGEISTIFPYKKNLLTLTLRNPFSEYRAFRLNYTHPFFNSKDLFIYVKGFSGYGESLIAYDQKIHKIGIGFSISRY